MKECKQCGGKVYSVGSSVHQTCRDEYIETLEAENKALRKVYKHAKGLCMGIDWNDGTAAQHHRDELENAVEEATLLLNTKEEL